MSTAAVKILDPEAWAARIAAALPPLTTTESAVIGRLAGELDTRRPAVRTAPPRVRRAA